FLADDAREALEFGRHLLIERDDLVEQHRQLDIALGPVLGKPDGEVAAAELAQRGNEFTPALRELAGRCLNIHASLRKARERPFPLDPAKGEPACSSRPKKKLFPRKSAAGCNRGPRR